MDVCEHWVRVFVTWWTKLIFVPDLSPFPQRVPGHVFPHCTQASRHLFALVPSCCHVLGIAYRLYDELQWISLLFSELWGSCCYVLLLRLLPGQLSSLLDESFLYHPGADFADDCCSDIYLYRRVRLVGCTTSGMRSVRNGICTMDVVHGVHLFQLLCFVWEDLFSSLQGFSYYF